MSPASRHSAPLPLLLLGGMALLLPATAGADAGGMGAPIRQFLQMKKDTVIIRTEAELNHHLADLASQLQDTTSCIFAGPLHGKAHASMLRSHWQDYCTGFSSITLPDGTVQFRLQYKDSTRLLAAHRNPALLPRLSPQEQQALQIAQSLAAQAIQAGMDELEKARALHDTLVRYASYQRQPRLGQGENSRGQATTLLLEKSGVCEAYSRTLYLLLNMADIPCHIVTGRTDEPHSWNLVRLNGEWYHIDATWDDPIPPDGRPLITHTYFLLNDKQMARDHSWQQGSLPVSATKDAYYFRQSGRYFTRYAELWQGTEEAARQGETEYEAYLTCYGSRQEFMRQLQTASLTRPALLRIRRWSGPETAEGTVRLQLDHAGKPARATEEILNLARETMGTARQWLQQEERTAPLRRFLEQADQPFFQEEGQQLWGEMQKTLRQGKHRIRQLWKDLAP